MIENQLKQLGFNKNETKVYLSLFSLGQCKAGQIIEHTGLHRNLVYTALEELAAKNIISKMEKGRVAVFALNDPEILKELIEEKLDIAKNVVEDLQSRLQTKPRDVRIYEGTEGVVATRDYVVREIKPNEDYYVMGVSYSTTNKELSSYFPKLNKKIIQKGGAIKVLVNGNEPSEVVSERGLVWGEHARYLPFGADSPMWMTLFRDTMNISIVGQDPITFSIRSQETADGFKKYFEYFWNQKVLVETGVEALRRAIYGMLDELNKNEEYFVLGASVGAGDERVQKLYDEYHKDRIKKGVVVNMLAFREGFKKIMDRFDYSGDPQGKVSHAKAFISAPPTPMQINVYKDKAFFIIYGDEPTVVKFDQPEIAQVFKNYFDSMWNQETQVLKGVEALRDLWLEGIDCKEIRWIGARGYFVDRYPEIWREIKNKAERTPGVVWKNIIDPDFKEHVLTKLPWTETKYNLGEIRNPTAIWLFGDKVLIVNWAEDIPVIFQSTNKQLVQSYSDYFEEMWTKGE